MPLSGHTGSNMYICKFSECIIGANMKIPIRFLLFTFHEQDDEPNMMTTEVDKTHVPRMFANKLLDFV